MATKPLPSQEVLRQLLDYDPETGALIWRERGPEWFPETRHQELAAKRWNVKNAGKAAFDSDHGNGYRSGALFKRKRYAHRVAWKWMTGEDALFVDHIDGDRRNNAWCNLRSVDKQGNARNSARPASNTSGYVGVSFDAQSGRWAAYIGYAPRKSLGRFKCITGAAIARKRAEQALGYHLNHGRQNEDY